MVAAGQIPEAAVTAEYCRAPGCRTRPEPDYAPRGLCQWCEDRGLEAINGLPYDWDDLQPLVWDKPAGGLGVTGGKFGPSEPVNYNAAALAGEIAYTAVLWEIVVRERARLSEVAMRSWPDGNDLNRAVRVLAAHYTALLSIRDRHDYDGYDGRPASADGVDVVVALTALHRRARSMVGITDRQTSVPGMCSVCHTETLRHRDGADNVFCAGCGATWTWDEHQDAVGLIPVGRAA